MEGKGQVEQQTDKGETPSHWFSIIDPSVIDEEDGVIHPFSIH